MTAKTVTVSIDSAKSFPIRILGSPNTLLQMSKT
jgi:hypothetical protein